MSATTKVYGHTMSHIYGGGINWTSDTIKLALTTSSYAVSQANDEFFSDVTNELAGTGGYTSGGVTLSSKSTNYDSSSREYQFIAGNVSIATLTPSSAFRYAVVYKSTGTAATSPLIAYINFGADQNPSGLNFGIVWASTGVWYAQAS